MKTSFPYSLSHLHVKCDENVGFKYDENLTGSRHKILQNRSPDKDASAQVLLKIIMVCMR